MPETVAFFLRVRTPSLQGRQSLLRRRRFGHPFTRDHCAKTPPSTYAHTLGAATLQIGRRQQPTRRLEKVGQRQFAQACQFFVEFEPILMRRFDQIEIYIVSYLIERI
jgi:hypothetical protein